MSIRFPHLGIDLGYVGKTVSVFGFELTIYGILVMAGMLLGLTVVVLQAKRQNQDQNLYLEALIPGTDTCSLGSAYRWIILLWRICRRGDCSGCFLQNQETVIWKDGRYAQYRPGIQSDDRNLGKFFQQRIYRNIYGQHFCDADSGRDSREHGTDIRDAETSGQSRRCFLGSGTSSLVL